MDSVCLRGESICAPCPQLPISKVGPQYKSGRTIVDSITCRFQEGPKRSRQFQIRARKRVSVVPPISVPVVMRVGVGYVLPDLSGGVSRKERKRLRGNTPGRIQRGSCSQVSCVGDGCCSSLATLRSDAWQPSGCRISPVPETRHGNDC